MIVIIIGIIFFSIIFIFILVKMLLGGGNRIKDGDRLESQGRFHDALAVYDKMIAQNNITPELRWKIANAAIKVNLIPRAQKELNVLISTKSFPSGVTLADAKALSASCLIMCGKEREALMEIKEAMRLNPNLPTLSRDLGTIYCNQAQTKKGILYLEKYTNLNGKDQDALKTLGLAYLDVGNGRKALSTLERALKVKNSDTGDIYFYLGVLYLSEKKLDQAIHTLNIVFNKKTSPEMISDAYKNLAICYKEKNLIDESIIAFEKATEYAKSNLRDIKNKINMYNHAVLLAKKNKLANAKKVFSELIMIDPGFKDTRIAFDAVNALLSNKPTDYQFKFMLFNPTDYILVKGLLYSKSRFNVEAFEAELDAKLDDSMPAPAKKSSSASTSQAPAASRITVEQINEMPVKEFKETAQKIIGCVGYKVKSDIRFQGDTEYMDGNAVNYLVEQQDSKNGANKVFSVRRFTEEVPEISVSNFIDWLQAKEIKNGIYIATNNFNKNAIADIQKHPNIKFIDQNGLSRILARIK